MVSMSITVMFLNPIKAKFFRSSQPRPPAPMTRTLMFSSRKGSSSGEGVKEGGVRGPRLSKIFSR